MLRIAFATAFLVTTIVAIPRAQACEPLPCSSYSLSAMTVPENAAALWLRVYPSESCAPTSASLRRGDGSVVDLDIVSDAKVGGPFRWLVPKSAFPAGETATLEATGECSCDAATKTRKVAITFGPAAEAPTVSGTPSVTAPTLVDAQQVSLPLCTSSGIVGVNGKAIATDVSLTLDPALKAWAPLLRFRLRVDGAPFEPLLDELEDPFPGQVLYGNANSGSIKLRVGAHCGPLSPPGVKASWFVAEGAHDVALEATIAGDASRTLLWPSTTVSLVCPSLADAGVDASETDAGVDAASDAIASADGGSEIDAASDAPSAEAATSAGGSGCSSTSRRAGASGSSLSLLCALAFLRRRA
jgi:hypothetical protein